MNPLKEMLDLHAQSRNDSAELSLDRPDPLLVAKEYQDEIISLACALYGYGNALAIVRFLKKIDFSLLDQEEATIRLNAQSYVYRFQNGIDSAEFLVTLSRLKQQGGVYSVFYPAYCTGGLLGGLASLIEYLYELNDYRSYGYEFLIGKPISEAKKAGAMKRWMMYLRWMVRHDHLDMGLWKDIKSADLIMPLDTHTFNVSRRLGLLKRSTCDLQAALELTETLKSFDPRDPVRYDFALYRLGQEKRA